MQPSLGTAVNQRSVCERLSLSYASFSVFDEYLKISGKPIEVSIRGELSGDFEKLMLAVGKWVRFCYLKWCGRLEVTPKV